MTKSYGDKEVKLKPGNIPPAALTAIGRLVRAFAEIEDIINLYIGNLAGTSEGMTAIFLGKMGISSKLELALYLAQLHGTAAADIHKRLFDASFSEVLACRNHVAHGVFLGKGIGGGMVFLTSNRLEPVDGKLSRETATHRVSDLKEYAKAAEDAIPFLSDTLRLTTSREIRFRQSLLPHRKSKGQDQSNKGQKNPPRSSQAKPSRAQRRKDALARAGGGRK